MPDPELGGRPTDPRRGRPAEARPRGVRFQPRRGRPALGGINPYPGTDRAGHLFSAPSREERDWLSGQVGQVFQKGAYTGKSLLAAINGTGARRANAEAA